MLMGIRQLTSLIHCCLCNWSFKKFLGAWYLNRETLPLSKRECTVPIRILGLLIGLPLINPTNWVSFMLVVTGGCEQLKMVVEKPPKWLFRLNFFSSKVPDCLHMALDLLNNALLFFSPICFSFSRKTRPKYRRIVEWCAMKRNKGNDYFNLHAITGTCYVAQLIRARVCEGIFS